MVTQIIINQGIYKTLIGAMSKRVEKVERVGYKTPFPIMCQFCTQDTKKMRQPCFFTGFFSSLNKGVPSMRTHNHLVWQIWLNGYDKFGHMVECSLRN